MTMLLTLTLTLNPKHHPVPEVMAMPLFPYEHCVASILSLMRCLTHPEHSDEPELHISDACFVLNPQMRS